MVDKISTPTGKLSKHLLALVESHPHVAKGVQRILDQWKAYFDEPKEGKWSIGFEYAKGHVAFRIESSHRPDGIPRIVVYSGDRDNERGSPLLRGIERKDFSKRFGIEPRPGKEHGDWEKILTEDTPLAFYAEFVEYALAKVRSQLTH